MEARVVVSSGLLGVQGEDTVAGNEIWITTVDRVPAGERFMEAAGGDGAVIDGVKGWRERAIAV